MPTLAWQEPADGYAPWVWTHGDISIIVEHTIDVGWGTPIASWEYDQGNYLCTSKKSWSTEQEALDDLCRCFPQFKGKYKFGRKQY